MASRYILTFQNGLKVLNATSKAPSDMAAFLEKDGFKQIYIDTMGDGKSGSLRHIISAVGRIVTEVERNSIVVVQYPVYSKKGSLILHVARALLKTFKGIRFIALIHDVRYLRQERIREEDEVRELNRYSSVIVHSEPMGQALRDSGCRVPYAVLGLFDYAVSKPNSVVRRLSRDVCFAGNLEKFRAFGDASQMGLDGVRFILYGRPVPTIDNPMYQYLGAFDSSDVSSLEGSWGLVWEDNYQKYNSSHKASLYVVAQMPLIVSSDAAVAEIVRSEHIGICIDSLQDIGNAISQVDAVSYGEMLENLRRLSQELTSGANIRKAVAALCQGQSIS